MINKNLYVAVFFSMAIFFSCNNSNNTASNNHEEHNHADVPVKSDTAAIEIGQEVFFENLKDGDIVSSPVVVKMGIKNMTVEAANAEAPKNKGHHHLLVDTMHFIPSGIPVPAIENKAIHFGKGQTETTLKLSPGKHTISMQFADGLHRSYGVRMSKTVQITVK